MKVPINKLLNKAFQGVRYSAEYSAAQSLLEYESIDKNHPYFLARTGRVNWNRCPFCPDDLSVPYIYWKTPWADKTRAAPTRQEIDQRTMRFPELLDSFRDIICNISEVGGWIGRPVKGIKLEKLNKDYLVIYLDGNHRIAAMKALGFTEIPMSLVTFDYMSTLQSKIYSREDNEKWWNYVWDQIS